MADLYQISNNQWAVKTSSDAEVEVFTNIEDAAARLESVGVQDDAIDVALAEMAGHGHSRANFGVRGTFIMTDESRLNELLGTA